MANNQNESWTTIIRPRTGWFDIDLHELWQYRDLIWMFVKRNFTVLYKQTILGPAWVLLNPLITTIIFNVIFTGIANIPTDGVPSFLFYMAGNTVWTLFANCINNTANTFVANAGVMGKVYFPRLTVPISQVLTALLNFGIQLVMFLCFWVFFAMSDPGCVHFTIWLLYLPVLLLEVLMLGLGVGIIVSSLTTKYRDLAIAVGFGVQLWMYATPVVYPLSILGEGWMRTLLQINPVTESMELMRYAILGQGTVSWGYYFLSWGVTLVIAVLGIMVFNKVERTFMDTV